MQATDLIQVLNKYGILGAHHVMHFEGYMKINGEDCPVSLEIKDYGPLADTARYHCVATSRGKNASGNSSHSIDAAIACVHWGELG